MSILFALTVVGVILSLVRATEPRQHNGENIMKSYKYTAKQLSRFSLPTTTKFVLVAAGPNTSGVDKYDTVFAGGATTTECEDDLAANNGPEISRNQLEMIKVEIV
jgi:hypothetical protein